MIWMRRTRRMTRQITAMLSISMLQLVKDERWAWDSDEGMNERYIYREHTYARRVVMMILTAEQPTQDETSGKEICSKSKSEKKKMASPVHSVDYSLMSPNSAIPLLSFSQSHHFSLYTSVTHRFQPPLSSYHNPP